MLSRGMTWDNIAILRKFDSSIAILQSQVDDAVLRNEAWLKLQAEQTMNRYEEMRRLH
jgi:hypothetical protein